MVQLFKLLSISLILFCTLEAKEYSEEQIKKLIGKTIILGFDGFTITDEIKTNIDRYNLGGVILFSIDYKTREPKNISSFQQLKKLTHDIQNYSSYKMFISIDQEGGKVQRLNSKNGFTNFPSAKQISALNKKEIQTIYYKLSKQLHESGINLNFAPVVDMQINPNNHVIVGLERSYSKDSDEVTKYASIFMEQMEQNQIFSVLKHFPGHGSSTADSHQ